MMSILLLTGQLVLSTMLCEGQQQQKRARADLAKELHYARMGGVIDRKEVYILQRQIRFADEEIQYARKRLKGKPISCKNDEVVEALTCLDQDHEEMCEGAAGEVYSIKRSLPSADDGTYIFY